MMPSQLLRLVLARGSSSSTRASAMASCARVADRTGAGNVRQLAERDERDEGNREPDEGADDLHGRLARSGLDRRQAEAEHAEHEAEPDHHLELLTVGRDELRPIARELLADP